MYDTAECMIRLAATGIYNLPVFERNHFWSVIANTYTTDQRKEVIQHAASEYIIYTNDQEKDLK